MTAEELRKSILQMAIQGKLVKQDPNDEPASVLLERIREEKTRLIKEGKIKGKMTDSVIYKGSDNSYYEKVGNKTVDIATELPFDIPDNWCWCRMDSIFKIVVGATPSTSVGEYWNNGNIPWLPSGCCQDCTVDLSYPKIKYITQKGYDSCSTTMMFPSTVLIALTGATAGKVGLLTINACANQSVVGISAFIGIDPKFLYYQLMARRGEILSDCIGSAQPHISKDYITKMFFALPPLAEQQRIVTRISELNPLLIDYDSLEAQERKLDESLPNELRKSILQYAIQGKLVPQNPSDEPASVLLERIRSEREKANGGKKSKAKTESYIFKNSDDNSYYEKIGEKVVCIDEEIPFELPNGWVWTRLGNIGYWGAGATPLRSNGDYYGGKIPWLKTGELNGSIIYGTQEHITEKALKECSLRLCEPGDVLIAMYGATIGKLAIAGVPMTTNQACCACTVHQGISNLYLFRYLEAIKPALIEQGAGGAQPNISREKIVNTLIPLPPTKEQHRICTALDKILEIASH